MLFTLDTESGFRDVVFVTASYGLGEMVVQGAVNPDEFYVYKPTLKAGKPAILRRSLGSKQLRMVYSNVPGERVRTEDTPAELRSKFSITDADVQELAKQALVIEATLRPADGHRMGQGRQHRQALHPAGAPGDREVARTGDPDRTLCLGKRGEVLAEGRAIGNKIGKRHRRAWCVRWPTWNACSRRRAGRGHDRSRLGTGDEAQRRHRHQPRRPHRHAAIIAALNWACRRWSAPATRSMRSGRRPGHGELRRGDTGFIYAGALPFERTTTDLDNMPPAPLKIMMNVAPGPRFDFGMLPNAGIGLARLEMIIASHIGVHPKALLEYAQQDAATKAKIDARIAGYANPGGFLRRPAGRRHRHHHRLGRAKPVIVRLSDFKSNEYANLIGGAR